MTSSKASAGFGAALCGQPDWRDVTAGLGTDFNITRMTQKNHGCCGHTFAAIDAAMQIVRDRHGLDPARIAAVRVATYQVALDVTGNFQPTTAFEARFSLPYVVAHGLLHGAARLDAFQPQRMADPAIRIADDPHHAHRRRRTDRRLPAPARRTGGDRDGRWQPACPLRPPYRRGDPEAPLDDAMLTDKFMELGAPVIGAGPAARLLDALWQLGDRPVRALGLGQLRAG